jgi:hypothetical protein
MISFDKVDLFLTQNRRYVAGRGYNLLTVANYGKVIEKVGFSDVEAIDKTEQFIDVLENEICKFKLMKDGFIQVNLFHELLKVRY